jgi:hypothetical protein
LHNSYHKSKTDNEETTRRFKAEIIGEKNKSAELQHRNEELSSRIEEVLLRKIELEGVIREAKQMEENHKEEVLKYKQKLADKTEELLKISIRLKET